MATVCSGQVHTTANAMLAPIERDRTDFVRHSPRPPVSLLMVVDNPIYLPVLDGGP